MSKDTKKVPVATKRTKTKGKIISWLRQKGFGFVKSKDGEKDIFLHREYVSMAQGQPVCLRQGMEVEFDECSNDDKTWAENATAVGGGPIDFFKKHGPDDRQIFKGAYTGILCEFNFKARRGYVLPTKTIKLPKGEKKKVLTQYDRLTIRWEDFLCKDSGKSVYLPDGYLGMKVKFQVYKTIVSDPNGTKDTLYSATSIKQASGEPFDGTDGKPRRQKPKIDRQKEKELAQKIDDKKVYKGLVLQCRVNAYGFILADKIHHPELEQYGKGAGQLYFSNNDINTDNSPALVLAGTRVSFRLSKETGRLAAVNVSNEDGSSIDCPDDKKPSMEKKARTVVCDGKRFTGTVWYYDWDKTWGCVKVDVPDELPTEIRDAMRREGRSLYFHWKDIRTTDKIHGLNNGTAVTFHIYKDEKGVGAGDVSDPNGEPFHGIDCLEDLLSITTTAAAAAALMAVMNLLTAAVRSRRMGMGARMEGITSKSRDSEQEDPPFLCAPYRKASTAAPFPPVQEAK